MQSQVLFATFVQLLLLLPGPAGSGEWAAPVAPGREELAARRGKVLEALEESGGILLLGSPPGKGGEGQFEGSHHPDRNLIYLTGMDQDAVLLLSGRDLGEGGREVLFLPPRGPLEGVWITPRLDAAGASRRSGIAESSILELNRLPDVLKQALAGSKRDPGAEKPRFYFDPGRGVGPGEPLPRGYGFLLSRLGTGAFHLDLQHPRQLIAPLRQVKSSTEIRLIERAVDITCAALRKAMRAARPGVYEYQLAALIEYEFKMRGARELAFPAIIGSGPNACILHHERLDRRIAGGDLVLMDVGAEYCHYAADITRTVPASGRFTERERLLYGIVLRAQEAGIRSIRPGVSLAEVQRVTRKEVARGLLELGLIRSEAEARKYLPHGTSHGLGLDVHDPIPGRILRAGMVITVEPGIYLPRENLGIRIEDDVLVTGDGCRVLSAGLPRTAEEVERWIARKSF